MANLKNLKKFSDYDATRKPSKDIKSEELNKSLQNMKKKNAEMLREQTKRDKVLQERINRLIPLIKLAEQTVNDRIRSYNNIDKVKISEFRLATTLSVSSVKNTQNGLMTRFNYNVVENGFGTPSTMNLNIDVNKFLKYSAVEAYTILTSTLYKSVVGKDLRKYFDLQHKTPSTLKSEAKNEKTNDIRFTFEYGLAKYKLEKYVKNYIAELKNNFEVYSTPEEIVENLMKYSLTDQAILDIANGKFVMSKLDRDIKILHTSELGLDDYKSAKMDSPETQQEREIKRTSEEQKWLITDKEQLTKVYKLVDTTKERSDLANSHMMQDEELKQSFNDVKDLFTDGFDKTPRNMQTLQNFCTNFTNSYMSAHGLSGIEIRFLNDKSNPAMGEYFDCGSSHYIEINLAKVDGLVELTATLAHELTHAVDSCYHKDRGQYNAYGGGIIDGTSTDISNSGLVGEAKKLLEELNMECYRVDPCEQRARNGEHIGLDFVEKLAGNEFSEELKNYRNSDKEYQIKINNCKANLSNFIAEAERKIERLGISKSSRGYSMLMEKIKYLKEREMEYNKDVNEYDTRVRANLDEEKKKHDLEELNIHGNTQEMLDDILSM